MRIVIEQDHLADGPFQDQSPAIVFHAERIHERSKAVFRIVEREGVKILLAVKAAPNPAVVSLVISQIHGLDISNVQEYKSISNHCRGKILSFTGPICTRGLGDLNFSLPECVIVNAETEEQLANTLALSDRGIVPGLRFRSGISPVSPEGAPPFGFDPVTLGRFPYGRQLGHIRAAHGHGGGRNNSKAVIMARAQTLVSTTKDLDLNLSHINYGGGFAALSLDEFQECLRDLVALTADRSTTVIEPGEFFYQNCGWAEATVLDITSAPEGARAILDLSSEAHLRWSIVGMAEPNADREAGVCRVDFVGPTCHRGDYLGFRDLNPSHGRPYGVRIGDRVRILGITSYSASWNLGIMGIPPANIVMLGL